MTLEEWVGLVCRELQVERPDVPALLDFTRDIAHGVARPAAPLTALLVGLAASGDVERLPAVLAQVRALIPPTSPDS